MSDPTAQGCICPQDGSTCWTCGGTPCDPTAMVECSCEWIDYEEMTRRDPQCPQHHDAPDPPPTPTVATLTADLEQARRLAVMDGEGYQTAVSLYEARERQLKADLAQARQDAQVLRDYIAARTTPRQGAEPQYDQSDADAFYLADENHKLRQQLAEAQQARDVAQQEAERERTARVNTGLRMAQQVALAEQARDAALADAQDIANKLQAVGCLCFKLKGDVESAARTALLEAAEDLKQLEATLNFDNPSDKRILLALLELRIKWAGK